MSPANTANRAQRQQAIQEQMLRNRNQLGRPEAGQAGQQRNIL